MKPYPSLCDRGHRGPDERRAFARFAFVFVVVMAAGRASAQTVTVAIDPNADRHPVSAGIYGINFGTAAQMSRLKVPIRRWGGNSVTRYNWQTDSHNAASDWFFFNYTNTATDPGTLPNGSSADVFVDEIRAGGGEALITVPLIGWTSIDRTRRWGFSVQKYGLQKMTECTASGNASWCNPDAGNGVRLADGTNITGNDPTDTSKTITSSFVTGWMAHLAARVGTASAGGVRLWELDNEPMLWNSTHRDVHPAAATFDELWSKTSTIAPAIKAQDPQAHVFGPISWGWCEYFYSAADGCSPGADRAAHGGMDLIPWYLQQAKNWEAAHGVRILDALDIHYYPQSTGVALTNDESAGTSALRLRSLKSLYDPTYVDESWIGQAAGQPPIQLVPRMKAWIAANYPGMKFAISEYNWGSDDGISGALAQAEALAIFGREGVDVATRWVAPAEGTKTEDAFLLYRNYDGAGAQVAGDSVQAISSNGDAVGSYAVRGGLLGSTLYVLLFNKDTSSHTTTVSVAGGVTQAAKLFQFTNAARLGAAGTATPASGAYTLSLPARSATLAVVPLPVAPTPPAAPTSFHPATPCRVLDTRNATGALGGPALAGGFTRTFVLTGSCGIPSRAVSVSANVTITQPSAAGTIVAFPGDLGGTPTTTTIAFRAGMTRANNAVLLLARDGTGRVSFSNDLPSGIVHLIVDVNGWWE